MHNLHRHDLGADLGTGADSYRRRNTEHSNKYLSEPMPQNSNGLRTSARGFIKTLTDYGPVALLYIASWHPWCCGSGGQLESG